MTRLPRQLVVLAPPEDVRLDRYTKEESFDLARAMRPALTWAEFEESWEQHMAWKARRSLH